MNAAYILYDNLTLLDFVGFYDPLSRLQSQGHLPEFTWDLCGISAQIHDNFGLTITMDRVLPNLSTYDLIFVPGGFGTRKLRHNAKFMNWLETAGPVPLKTSVCTGSLLLGAAGFLAGRKATTHFNEYAALRPYCGEVVEEEIIVEDDGVITAGAVASSLPLGLYLCNKFVGAERAEQIRRSMAL